LSAGRSPDDRKQSDLIRELVRAKGVSRKDFDNECERLRKQVARDINNVPALTDPEVRYKDDNGHFRFTSAEAFYNWAAGLGGYETIRIAEVEHYGSAKLNVRPLLKTQRFLNLKEANQRIDDLENEIAAINCAASVAVKKEWQTLKEANQWAQRLEAELAEMRRSQVRKQMGSYYGKLGGRPKKSTD
jgi:hypothetical protein